MYKRAKMSLQDNVIDPTFFWVGEGANGGSLSHTHIWKKMTELYTVSGLTCLLRLETGWDTSMHYVNDRTRRRKKEQSLFKERLLTSRSDFSTLHYRESSFYRSLTWANVIKVDNRSDMQRTDLDDSCRFDRVFSVNVLENNSSIQCRENDIIDRSMFPWVNEINHCRAAWWQNLRIWSCSEQWLADEREAKRKQLSANERGFASQIECKVERRDWFGYLLKIEKR